MVGVATLNLPKTGLPIPQNVPKAHAFTYILSSMAAIGGFLYGYDTGVVSAAMLYVDISPDIEHLSNFWNELIVAATPGVAAIGAILAAPAADRFGRKPVIMISSAVFVAGAVFCAAAMSKEVLLIGRILLGLAIGFASMIVPVHLSESSPTHIRGPALSCFSTMATFGQMAANIIAGFFAFANPEVIGWRLMFGFAAVPAIIQFIGFLYLPESPRWLFQRYGETASRNVIAKIYNNDKDWIEYETAAVRAIVAANEKDCVTDNRNTIKRILSTPHVRRALIIGCAMQMFNQLAGINTIMYYTGDIIKSAGVKNNHTIIWLSAVVSSFNFFASLIPIFFIERLGRRKILIGSTIGVVIALLMMGGSFLVVNRDTALVGTDFPKPTTHISNFDHCASYSNCDYCVTDESCGFCSSNIGDTSTPGACLPVSNTSPDDSSSFGACASNANASSFEWRSKFCTTKYTMLPLVVMVIYLICFASGLTTAPWVLNAEFYPLWARSTCVGASTATNWIFNLLISATFLTLSEAITKYGAFFLYAFLTSIGVVIFVFFVPETKNKSLAEIEELFKMRSKQRKTKGKPKLILTTDISGCPDYGKVVRDGDLLRL